MFILLYTLHGMKQATETVSGQFFHALFTKAVRHIWQRFPEGHRVLRSGAHRGADAERRVPAPSGTGTKVCFAVQCLPPDASWRPP